MVIKNIVYNVKDKLVKFKRSIGDEKRTKQIGDEKRTKQHLLNLISQYESSLYDIIDSSSSENSNNLRNYIDGIANIEKLNMNSSTEELYESFYKISSARISAKIHSKSNLLEVFRNVDSIELSTEIDSYMKGDVEKGGKILYDVLEDGGNKKLILSLKEDAIWNNENSIDIGNLNEEEIGKWHSHVKGVKEPIPSYSDLHVFSSMNFDYPHILIAKKGVRLYMPEMLGKITNLDDEIMSYSPVERNKEIDDLGIHRNDEFFTHENLCYIKI